MRRTRGILVAIEAAAASGIKEDLPMKAILCIHVLLHSHVYCLVELFCLLLLIVFYVWCGPRYKADAWFPHVGKKDVCIIDS